jgi:CBS domain-containing protein
LEKEVFGTIGLASRFEEGTGGDEDLAFAEPFLDSSSPIAKGAKIMRTLSVIKGGGGTPSAHAHACDHTDGLSTTMRREFDGIYEDRASVSAYCATCQSQVETAALGDTMAFPSPESSVRPVRERLPISTSVTELMDRSIVCVRDTARLQDVAILFEEEELFAAPVIDASGKLVGLVTASDVAVTHDEESGEDCHFVADVMLPPFAVSLHTEIWRASALMAFEGIDFLAVAGRDRSVAGVVWQRALEPHVRATTTDANGLRPRGTLSGARRRPSFGRLRRVGGT